MATHASPTLGPLGAPEMPQQPSLHFGQAALVQEEQAAIAGLEVQYWNRQGDSARAARAGEQSAAHLKEVQAELQYTRGAIASLGAREKTLLNDYVAIHIGPAQIEHIGHRTFVDWLADPHRGATDHQLFNFLDWHVEQVAGQQQSEKVQTAIREEKAQYVRAQNQAVQDGHFSPYALATVGGVSNTQVYIGDLWDTVLAGVNGYHYPGSGYVVVAQGGRQSKYTSLEEETVKWVQETASHEFDHVRFGHWEAPWLREGVAQHNTLSLEDGRFHALSPLMRSNRMHGNQIYVPERQLIATLLEEGMVKLSADLVTRAHTSAGPDSQEWQAFMSGLDKAWGMRNTYRWVNERLTRWEARLREKHQTWDEHTYQIQAIYETIRDLHALRASKQEAVGRAATQNSVSSR